MRFIFTFIFTVTLVPLSFSQEKNKLKLLKVYDIISNNYVDSVSKNELTENAIEGMLDQLDPHSVYIPPKEAKERNENLKGNFDGIGIRYYMIKDTMFVSKLIDKGPSEKAGIKVGDKFITINKDTVAGKKLSSRDYREKLTGTKGSIVEIEVERNKELKTIKIKRGKVNLYSIRASYVANDSIGYIKLTRFARTSEAEMLSALKKLQKKGMKHLILDLRDNGGGYLGQAVKIAGHFLGKKKLVVYTQGNNAKIENLNAQESGRFTTGNLVVLINENSASASEIVSGAIQDWDRGIIIGRRSFGKGLVQRQYKLLDGSMVRVTISRYYTPSGRSIQKKYDLGAKNKYSKEKEDRLKSGELFHRDSIIIIDSLTVESKVLKRPILSGSGGIIPDLFISLDTSGNSTLLSSLSNDAILPKFVLERIIIENKYNLAETYPSVESFRSFTLSDEHLDDLKNYAVNKFNIDWSHEDFVTSEIWIKNFFKAHIARQLYGEDAFFIYLNIEDKEFVKAIEVLSSTEYEFENLSVE